MVPEVVAGMVEVIVGVKDGVPVGVIVMVAGFVVSAVRRAKEINS